MLRALRARLGEEDAGFTVVEVVLTSAILLLVTAAFLSTLVSMTGSEQRASALVNNEQDARFVLKRMARELREANPLASYPTIGEYRAGFQATIGKEPNRTTVRWRYAGDPTSEAGGTLSRSVLDTATGAWRSTVVLTRLRNDAADPLFEYRSRSGADLLALGNATDVANCTVRVKVSVTADSNPGPQPYTVKSDVHLRNQLTKDAACP